MVNGTGVGAWGGTISPPEWEEEEGGGCSSDAS